LNILDNFDNSLYKLIGWDLEFLFARRAHAGSPPTPYGSFEGGLAEKAKKLSLSRGPDL